MKNLVNKLYILLTALVMSTSASLQAEEAKHNFSEWSIGEHLAGDNFSTDDLKEKVIVIDKWGTRCGPCLALMPHIAKLDKKYREDGLRIIGAESQGSSTESINKIVKSNKVKFMITKGSTGPVKTSFLPYSFVFNRAGELIFKGNPADSEFERAIKKALKESDSDSEVAASTNTGPLLRNHTWTNLEGKKIQADLLSIVTEEVKLRLVNGSVVNYRIEKLSKEDQDLIKGLNE